MRASASACLLSAGVVSVVVGCSAPVGRGAEGTDSTGSSIIGGSPATSYPESAILDIYQGGQIVAGCSGSIIGPGVALTAGHCVYGWDGWDVTIPYNGAQKVHGSTGTTYDWKVMAQTVDPTLHDIGLVFLDTQVHVSSSQCPVLAQKPVKSNTNVVNIGRIDNGQLSYTDLFVGPPTPVTLDGPAGNYPFDYEATDVIQEGDSGGPDEVPGSSPHEIVSVNSGAGSGEVLARVDLLYTWIQQQAQSHGGLCGVPATTPDAGAGNDGGGSSGGGSSSSGGSSSGGGSGGTSGDGGTTTGGSLGGGGNGAAPGWGSGSTSGASGCSIAPATSGAGGIIALLGLVGVVATRRRKAS